MAEVGRDLWRLSGLTLLLKQGFLELAAHSNVQAALLPSGIYTHW